MKKRFLSKSLIAKIALVLVIILVFEFVASEPVHAASLGGTLLNPIVNLVVYLADGVIQILQSALTSIDNSFSYIGLSTGTSWSKVLAVAAMVVGILLAAGAIILSGGTATPLVIAVVVAGGAAYVGGSTYLCTYPNFGKKLDAVLFGTSFVYPTIYVTPETILKNQIKLFDVNYFQKVEEIDGNMDTTVTLANTLRNVVSQMYITIRDVALVAMLIVIIYVAIRMILALTPKEKSRYKESAINCIIGLVLILIMHYIMSISVTTLEMITNSVIFTDQTYDIEESQILEFLESNPDAYNKAISGETLEVVGDELYDAVQENIDNYPGMMLGTDEESGENAVYIKASNFTEKARYMAQKIYELDSDDNTVETWEHIGWAFVYIMLVILTIAFIVMYAKRTLYMAVLTMFAPIVGLMYPINRVNGGRSHTLNLWFREYMGNLIIQPFHLLLYAIFIGSAMEMALKNPVYVIVAIMGLMFVERLLRELLGIQDTKIGSLGKSLQDTTRAIKTTEKAATSIARTVGRTVSKGAYAVAGMTIGSATKNSEEEQSEENGANNPVRVQQNPTNSGDPGGKLPPPTGGAQNPTELDNGFDNGAKQPQEQKPQQKKLDEVATMQKYMSEGGRQNEKGEYFNPYTNEFDPNYNPLTDPLFQVNKEVDESATMQRYMSEGGSQNANGEYFNPYREEFEAGFNPLNEEAFQVYKDENIGIGSGAEALDNDTLSMVDSLNGTEAPFRVIEGAGGDVGDVLRTDGYRDMLGTDNDQIIRMETRDMPDDTTPMASALSPAAGAENINMSVSGSGNLRIMGNTGDIESVLETGNTSTARNHSSGSSGVTSFGISGGAQNIPDGNNLRVVNDVSNNGITETPIDFTSRKEDILAKRASAGETIPIDNNVNNNVNTDNIHRLTPDEYEVIEPERDSFQVLNGGRAGNSRTNAGGQTNSRTNPAPANNNANPEPANNNAPQNNSGTNAGGQTNNGTNPAPANNNVPQNNNTPVGAGPVSARNQCKCTTK